MTNQTILNWINQNKEKKSETEIKDELIKKGWNLENINDALDVAFGRKAEIPPPVSQPAPAKKTSWWAWGCLVLIIIVVVVAVISCTGEEKKEEHKEEKVAEEEREEEIKPEPEPEIIELDGTGQQASKKFTLESGLSIFRMTHTGQSNFAIMLLDENGEIIELLVNEIGSFDGAKAVGITKKGEYLLDISADRKWSVKIEQPRPIEAPSIPKTLAGKGQQVSEMFTLDKGLTTFKMTHNGSSNFAVILLDNKGQSVELLVNEIGIFDGSKAVGIIKSGIYLLDIQADGEWSIAIE